MATMWLDGKEVPMPAAVEAALPKAEAPAVPMAVSNFQGRTALRHAGMFDAADAAVEAMAVQMDEAGDAIGAATLREAWTKAQFMRASPLIARVAELLNLTEAQMDELFIAAASIEV